MWYQTEISISPDAMPQVAGYGQVIGNNVIETDVIYFNYSVKQKELTITGYATPYLQNINKKQNLLTKQQQDDKKANRMKEPSTELSAIKVKQEEDTSYEDSWEIRTCEKFNMEATPNRKLPHGVRKNMTVQREKTPFSVIENNLYTSFQRQQNELNNFYSSLSNFTQRQSNPFYHNSYYPQHVQIPYPQSFPYPAQYWNSFNVPVHTPTPRNLHYDSIRQNIENENVINIYNFKSIQRENENPGMNKHKHSENAKEENRNLNYDLLYMLRHKLNEKLAKNKRSLETHDIGKDKVGNKAMRLEKTVQRLTSRGTSCDTGIM